MQGRRGPWEATADGTWRTRWPAEGTVSSDSDSEAERALADGGVGAGPFGTAQGHGGGPKGTEGGRRCRG